jgi:hypothetical protein
MMRGHEEVLNMACADEIDELRTKIANYKHTRSTSAKSFRPWCDRLIREAEAELRELTGGAQPPLPMSSPSAAFVQSLGG